MPNCHRRRRPAGEAEVVAEHGTAVLADVAGHFAQRHLDAGADALARWLANQQQDGGEEHAGRAEHEKDQLPRAHHAEHRQFDVALCRGELDHQPAEQERQTRADVDAHGVNAHRGTAQLRREAVGDQRVGRGRAPPRRPRRRCGTRECQKVLAVPHSAVIRLQTSTPMAMMPRRLLRSAKRARWARRRWCRTLRRKSP